MPTLSTTSALTGAAITAAGYLSTTAIGSALLMTGAGMVLGGLGKAVGLGPKIPQAQLTRLNLSFDPNAPRKIVFGETAMGTDLLYWEPSGTDDEFADYIIACAAHKVTSIDAIYFDDKLAWNGSVQATYSGYLWVTAILEGTSANTVAINGGTTWGPTCRLTGCAYVHIRIKRSGNSKKTASPLVNGLPSRLTIKGKGMPVYDARYDSTNGGSGSLRANDQTTWAYTVSGDNIGENPACQLFTSLLGWKIGGVVSVGAGLPSNRLDWADQVTAANHCDSTVSGAKRFVTHGMFSDDQAPSEIMEVLAAHMCATPRDLSGKLGLRCSVNDLSGTILQLTEADILGALQIDEGPGLNDTINVVKGRYTDASTQSLYQLAPYTKRSVSSADGINREMTLDLPMFQDAIRAELVAYQVLQRQQVQLRVTGVFGPRALAVDEGSPVKLTFGPRSWTDKLFRVEKQERRVILDQEAADQLCPMTLVEESTAIYATPTTTTPGAAVTVPSWNPLSDPLAATVAFSDTIVSDISPTTGRVIDPTHYNTQAILGPTNASNIVPTQADNGTNVTVTIPAHDRKIAGASGPVTLSYGGGSATVAYATQWWVYVDDPNLTGFTTPTYVLTTNADDLLYPGRYEVANGLSVSAGGGGGNTGGGGGWGGGNPYEF